MSEGAELLVNNNEEGDAADEHLLCTERNNQHVSTSTAQHLKTLSGSSP